MLREIIRLKKVENVCISLSSAAVFFYEEDECRVLVLINGWPWMRLIWVKAQTLY